MKKVLLSIFLLVLLGSCTKEYYYYPDTPSTDGVVNGWKIIQLSVRTSDWRSSVDDDGLNLYYYADFSIPEITNNIYLNGLVQCYRDYGGRQTLLPSVLHIEDTDGDRWTQTVDYEYYPGGISIYVTCSDFYPLTPEAMDFVLHIIW